MPNLNPEQRAREVIDELLRKAGWIVQRMADFNRNAGEGVAVREFVLPNGPCDYLLFVGGKAAGVIEAKKAGMTLSGIVDQAAKYVVSLPPPDEIAAEIVENLQAALEAFQSVTDELAGKPE